MPTKNAPLPVYRNSLTFKPGDQTYRILWYDAGEGPTPSQTRAIIAAEKGIPLTPQKAGNIAADAGLHAEFTRVLKPGQCGYVDNPESEAKGHATFFGNWGCNGLGFLLRLDAPASVVIFEVPRAQIPVPLSIQSFTVGHQIYVKFTYYKEEGVDLQQSINTAKDGKRPFLSSDIQMLTIQDAKEIIDNDELNTRFKDVLMPNEYFYVRDPEFEGQSLTSYLGRDFDNGDLHVVRGGSEGPAPVVILKVTDIAAIKSLTLLKDLRVRTD